MSKLSLDRKRRRLRRVSGAVALVSAWLLLGGVSIADGPGVGTPWIVGMGDSYMSGEAGRWAGNTSFYGPLAVDALGSSAYDGPESFAGAPSQIANCHRAHSSEIYIGGNVGSLNLACSGAKTNSFYNWTFKPGLDFFESGLAVSQSKGLWRFAADHNVKLITVSIGGNDFGFGDIVQGCLSAFLFNYRCAGRAGAISPAQLTAVIKNALWNIHGAMLVRGYKSSAFTILVQDYPTPIPPAISFRYPETGVTRQTTGGCGFWNSDANWATGTLLPSINAAVKDAVTQMGLPNIKFMEVRDVLNGHRLCEKGVGLLEEKGYRSWQGAQAATEWVSQVRTASTPLLPYQLQEGLHPNYWGQLALRNCVRLAYNGGTPRGGTCSAGGTAFAPTY